MIDLPIYNPCTEYIEEKKHFFRCTLKIKKDIIIKYDKKCFITNMFKEDISKVYDFDEEYFFNSNGLLTIKVDNNFYIDNIEKCPIINNQFTGDIFLDGIIKRMFSQIKFGYFNEDMINIDEIDICHNIFKSIYSKSPSIKMDNIHKCIDKFNCLQKTNHLNIWVIRGIAYAAYDYKHTSN